MLGLVCVGGRIRCGWTGEPDPAVSARERDLISPDFAKLRAGCLGRKFCEGFWRSRRCDPPITPAPGKQEVRNLVRRNNCLGDSSLTDDGFDVLDPGLNDFDVFEPELADNSSLKRNPLCSGFDGN